MKQQRMTKQKRLILELVRAHRDHPTADQMYLEVHQIDGKISRGTVYRNLDQLSNAGLLMHVKVPGADRFDWRLEYHYHMLCRQCGMVCDAPVDYQHGMDRTVLEKTGFQVERHRTVFEGICSACCAENPEQTERNEPHTGTETTREYT